MRAFVASLFSLLLGVSACSVQQHQIQQQQLSSAAAPASPPAAPPAASVWAVDLVRTNPGLQAEYLRGIAANWAGGRRIATERGVIRSYRALAGTPGSALGWDVLLMTEYADSASFANREAIFAEIFAMPRYVAGRYNSATPSAELRTIVTSTIPMSLVIEGSR